MPKGKVVHPDKVITNAGSQPGDALILTKPLGAGAITTALKQQIALPDDVAAAVTSMKLLNKSAALVARNLHLAAMTDITGFGLLGHAHEMAHLSNVRLQFWTSALPWLSGAKKYASLNALPDGTWRNKEFFQPWVSFSDDVDAHTRDLLWTPETSGGLLVAVPPDLVDEYEASYPEAIRVGRVVAGNGQIEVG